MIEVKVFATLREGREKINLLPPEGISTATDVLRHFAIPEAEVAILLLHRNPTVSPMFPLLLCIYPVFETVFSIYRRRFLRGLLRRERIYLGDFFHARLDAAARRHRRRFIPPCALLPKKSPWLSAWVPWLLRVG